MKHILLRLILSVIILITSNSSFYPLAPKSQLHDLNMVLPGLGRLGGSLLTLFDGVYIRNLVEHGAGFFLELEKIIRYSSIHIVGYEIKEDASKKIKEVIFYLQDNQGNWLRPVIIAHTKSSDPGVKLNQLIDTPWGRAFYRGPVEERRDYYLYELEKTSRPTQTAIPLEVLFKAFILYSARNILDRLSSELPNTFVETSSRGVIIPRHEEGRYVGISLTDDAYGRRTLATPRSLQDERWSVYRNVLHARIDQFFNWISTYMSAFTTEDSQSLELFAAFVKNETLAQLIPVELLERQRALFDGFLSADDEKKFTKVDEENLSRVFNAIGIDPSKFVGVEQNEYQVFARLLKLINAIRDKYRVDGELKDDAEMVKEIVQLLQESGFIASILEINTSPIPLWHDYFDFLPRSKGQVHSVVFVRVAGETFIIDINADQFSPKDPAAFYASKNPIPAADGQGYINQSSTNFLLTDQYNDLGVVLVPFRYIWNEVAKADLGREVWIDKLLRAFAVTIQDEEEKEFSVDAFVSDLKELFNLKTKSDIEERQLELAAKYDVAALNDTDELVTEKINALLISNKYIVPIFKTQATLMARRLYPYLGRKMVFRKLDGKEIWSKYDLQESLFDPLGIHLQLFINEVLLKTVFRQLGKPTVVDLSRMPALDSAA